MKRKGKKREEEENKVTSEKPVSLYPLDFRKALQALLLTLPLERPKELPSEKTNEAEK